MSTQHVRAAPPAPSATTAAAPEPSTTTTVLPSSSSTVIDTDVPIIRPYVVADLGAVGNTHMAMDNISSSPVVAAGSAGMLSTAARWRASSYALAGSRGTASAQIAAKGKVLLSAQLNGAGTASGTRDGVRTPAAGGSEGSAVAAVSGIATAVALFSGEGRLSGLAPETTYGTADGTLSAVTGATGPVVATALLAGVGRLSAITGSPAKTVATGALSVTTVLPANLASDGRLALAHTARASVVPLFGGARLLGAEVKTSFQPSGMKKSILWDDLTNDWTVVEGWAADTATYPGSTVTNHALIVQKPKSGATIRASVVFAGTSAFTQIAVSLRLMLGTVEIAVSSAPTVVAGEEKKTIVLTTTRDVAAGNAIKVMAMCNGNVQNYNPTVPVDPASFVSVT